MIFSEEQLIELHGMAERAAVAAARYIQQVDRQTVAVQNKSDNTSLAAQVVTEVDRTSEEIILQYLEDSLSRFDLAWLAEESSSEVAVNEQARLTKPAFWCVDPLDGTLPFIRNQSGYAVSIALVANNGTPLLGVVYDPVADALYSSLSKVSTTLHDQSGLTFVTDASFSERPEAQRWLQRLRQFSQAQGFNEFSVQSPGGAVMNACTVLQSEHAFYLKLPKSESGGGAVWDYAATAALFECAGKPVSDVFGHRLKLNPQDSLYFNRSGVLFSSEQSLHNALVDYLNSLI